MAVLSLIIFRFTEPDLKRPYRVWLSTPILFCIVALFLCTTPFIEAPIESLIALSVVLFAIPIWFAHVKYKEAIAKGWNSKYIVNAVQIRKTSKGLIVIVSDTFYFKKKIGITCRLRGKRQGYHGVEMTETN